MNMNLDFLVEALPNAKVTIGGMSNDNIKDVKQVNLPVMGKEYGVSIDTRTMKYEQIFIAINGGKLNGHDFLEDALKLKAAALIIDESEAERIKSIQGGERLREILVIRVENTLEALFDLARAWRKRFSFPVVAIAGSVGKTTTKEMVRMILYKAGMSACLSDKNYNTMIGLSLSILNIGKDDKCAVFEVASSKRGEMIQKADLLRPTIAAIIALAHAHIEGLGEMPSILKEKIDIFSFFRADNLGVISGDFQALANSCYHHSTIRFGLKTKNHIQARKVKIEFDDNNCATTNFLLRIYKKDWPASIRGNHEGNLNNALAAASIAHCLGISGDVIVEGLKEFSPVEGRFENKKLKSNKGIVINDCYNANPESMKAALLASDSIKVEGEKIAVLGDMLELGEKEVFWHRQVGRVLGKARSFDLIILVGCRAKEIAKTAPITTKIKFAEDWQSATTMLEEIIISPDSFVLVKGSLDVNLGKLVEKIAH
jgi:UDP-N-acetylmuramoyl-tripeptide--D-alanyl-D-alanine ligase